jgi:hypothetical protein
VAPWRKPRGFFLFTNSSSIAGASPWQRAECTAATPPSQETAVTDDDLTTALQAFPSGLHPLEAGVALLTRG